MTGNTFVPFKDFNQLWVRAKQFAGAAPTDSLPSSPTPAKSPQVEVVREGLITAVVYANKKWRVRVRGIEWFAQAEQPLALKVGEFVWVVGMVNSTTLLIDRKPG